MRSEKDLIKTILQTLFFFSAEIIDNEGIMNVVFTFTAGDSILKQFSLFSNKLKLHHSETLHLFDTLLCGYQNTFDSISERHHCFYFALYYV